MLVVHSITGPFTRTNDAFGYGRGLYSVIIDNIPTSINREERKCQDRYYNSTHIRIGGKNYTSASVSSLDGEVGISTDYSDISPVITTRESGAVGYPFHWTFNLTYGVPFQFEMKALDGYSQSKTILTVTYSSTSTKIVEETFFPYSDDPYVYRSTVEYTIHNSSVIDGQPNTHVVESTTDVIIYSDGRTLPVFTIWSEGDYSFLVPSFSQDKENKFLFSLISLGFRNLKRYFSISNPNSDYLQLENDVATSISSTDFNYYLFVDRIYGLLTGDWKDYVDTFKDLKNVPNLKNLSNAYLSEHYGLRLTKQSLQQFYDAAYDLIISPPRYHSVSKRRKAAPYTVGDLTVNETYQYKVWFKEPDITDGIYDYLQYNNFILNGTILFDIIPYSFVVDWFTNIGSRISYYDSLFEFDCVDYFGSISTRSTVINAPASFVASELQGFVTLTTFSRTPSLNRPTFLMPPLGSKFKPNKILPGLALLVQRS